MENQNVSFLCPSLLVLERCYPKEVQELYDVMRRFAKVVGPIEHDKFIESHACQYSAQLTIQTKNASITQMSECQVIALIQFEWRFRFFFSFCFRIFCGLKWTFFFSQNIQKKFERLVFYKVNISSTACCLCFIVNVLTTDYSLSVHSVLNISDHHYSCSEQWVLRCIPPPTVLECEVSWYDQ